MANFTNDAYFNGWTVGGGLETLLRGRWSTKIEHRYSQFESKFVPAGCATRPSRSCTPPGSAWSTASAPATRAHEPVAGPAGATGPGIYGGVAGGAGLMINRYNASFGSASANVDNGGQGLLGSVFFGGDYQLNDSFVAGLMGDLTWPGMQSVLTAGGGGASATLATTANMSWSALARLGLLPTRRPCSMQRAAIPARASPPPAMPATAARCSQARTGWAASSSGRASR